MTLEEAEAIVKAADDRESLERQARGIVEQARRVKLCKEGKHNWLRANSSGWATQHSYCDWCGIPRK